MAVPFAASLVAVRRVRAAAASTEFIRAVGEEAASIVGAAAEAAVGLLGAGAAEQGAAAVCDLAKDCLELSFDESASEEFGDANQHDVSETETRAELWGLGAVTAEVIANSLASLANLLEAGSAGGGVAGIDGIDPSSKVLELVWSTLRSISLKLDCLSVYIYGTLCRYQGSGDHAVADVVATDGVQSDRQSIERGLQGICVWTLITLGRLVGFQRLDGVVLWEWAHGDALWAFIAVTSVVAFSRTSEHTGRVEVPQDLQELLAVVVPASLSLHAPSIAFEAWREHSARLGDEVPIAERQAVLGLHRAQLASASVECCFPSVLIWQASMPDAPSCWSVQLAAFLSALLRPTVKGIARVAELQAGDVCCEDLHAPDVLAAVDSFASHLQSLELPLWTLLVGRWHGHQGNDRWGSIFIEHCAVLAQAVPPPAALQEEFVQAALVAHPGGGQPAMLAALCAFLANGNIEPELVIPTVAGAFGSRAMLGRALESSPPVVLAAVALWLLRFSSIGSGGSMVLRWADVVAASSGEASLEEVAAVGGEVICSAAADADVEEQVLPGNQALLSSQLVAPIASPRAAALSSGGLRSFLADVPEALRCALDGRLLVDPVRSPHGHVFERSVLREALLSSPGTCPISGLPLCLDQCSRAGDLRAAATRWVRQTAPRRLAPLQ